MTITVVLKPRSEDLGADITVALPTTTLVLSASTPSFVLTEPEIIDERPVWGPLFLNKLMPVEESVRLGHAKLKLKGNKLRIKVTKNHRSCMGRDRLEYSGNELNFSIAFSEARRLEEIELTEILASIL